MPIKKKQTKKTKTAGKAALANLQHDPRTIQALQQFISGTAQEIQHPLKGIVQRMQTLISKYEDRAFEYIGYKEYKDIFKTLAIIKDQVQYCHETTARLLDVTKKQIGTTNKNCDVNLAIREVKSLLAHTLKVTDVQLNLKLDSKLPYAAIGKMELSQVLVNVLTNAIQSMPSGGTVLVKTRHIKASHKIFVECQDNGVGIAKEALPYVFDPFFTTKERGLQRNSGLGLAIVCSIVERYKGKVEIKSSQRKGTEVTLKLPIYKNGRK